MIIVMKPELSLGSTPYKVLDISWISDFPDEREYLLFDHKIEIQTWILSSDYDQYYDYYQQTLSQQKSVKPPSNHLSYHNQRKIPKQLHKLQSLITEEEIQRKGDETVVVKENILFDDDGDGINEQDKISLLMWIFQFALGYKHGTPSKFDQSLHANIQHCMRRIHTMVVSPKLAMDFMEKLRVKYKRQMSSHFIRSTMDEFFMHTTVPLII